MKRLRKFREIIDLTNEESRVAYVMSSKSLPPALNFCSWREDTNFSAAEEVLADPDLKPVFAKALAEGYALKP